MRVIDLTGRNFGRLIVVERVPNPPNKRNTNAYWKCICLCGSQIIVRSPLLLRGKTSSCGCYRREFRRANDKGPIESLITRQVTAYKRAARHRGIAWELNREEARALFLANCYYCGVTPSRIISRDRKTCAVNGIDRKDNYRGYTAQNAVSCCWPCNDLKGGLNAEEFLHRIFLIASQWKLECP